MYCKQLQEHKNLVQSSEISLLQIKNVLCAVFGVKERTIEDQIGKVAKAGFGVSKVKKEEIEAWEKAGLKGSLTDFVKEYRKNGS